MKVFYFAAVLFLALTANSCQKEAEDPIETPGVTNSDLTGDFEGRFGNDLGNLGIVMYSFELKNENLYTASYEGIPVADVEVTGNQFVGTPLQGSGFKSFGGYISGDLNTVYISGLGMSDENFDYTGKRIQNGVRASTDMVVNGQEYTRHNPNNFADCDAQLSFEFIMFPSFIRKGAIGPSVNMTLSFDDIPTAGTYNVTSGQVGPSTLNAKLDYLGENIRGTSGSVVVTGDGTQSGVMVKTDNIIFNEDFFSKDPVTPISTQGTIQCNN